MTVTIELDNSDLQTIQDYRMFYGDESYSHHLADMFYEKIKDLV